MHQVKPLAGALIAAAALGVSGPVALAAAEPAVSRTAKVKPTADVDAGTLTVRATRLATRRVRVTFKLVVHVVRTTRASVLASPCTAGGCIDTGTRSSRSFALAPGTREVVRTVTLTRTSPGRIACILGQATDRGLDDQGQARLVEQLRVCP